MRTTRLRKASALLLAAALVVLGSVSAADAATPAARSTLWTQGSYEQDVQHWINVVRREHGLPGLTLASCPQATSTRWAQHLASTDTFYHQSMYTLLDKCHAHYAGETLGRGDISPQLLVRMWMHSPPHRAVLMSPSPRRIGIGSYTNAYGEWVTAANFIRF